MCRSGFGSSIAGIQGRGYGHRPAVPFGQSRNPLALRPSFLVRADPGRCCGATRRGEVCEVAGFGPISTQAALDLLATQDPFLKAIVTDGHKVVGVAHLGRRPTAHQRSALDWL